MRFDFLNQCAFEIMTFMETHATSILMYFGVKSIIPIKVKVESSYPNSGIVYKFSQYRPFPRK